MLLGWSRLLILFLFLLWASFIRYHEAFVCGVENVHDPLQHRVVLPLVLLANQLDVPQLSKIEVSLLLQVFHSKLQYIDLHKILERVRHLEFIHQQHIRLNLQPKRRLVSHQIL